MAGSAIERLMLNDFSPGEYARPRSGITVAVDSGSEVSVKYDPLIRREQLIKYYFLCASM